MGFFFGDADIIVKFMTGSAVYIVIGLTLVQLDNVHKQRVR